MDHLSSSQVIGAAEDNRMTLPKKGRRSICVDAVEYFYIVSFRRSDRAVIQSADGNGSFIFVLPFAILGPKHIATIIQLARNRGWNSDAENCWVVFDINDNDEVCLEWLANDDFRVVTYNTRGALEESEETGFQDTRQWFLRDRPTQPADLRGDAQGRRMPDK